MISIFLEIFHFIIPNRAFEAYDLTANMTGVILVFLIKKIFK
jgi:glycopeptide antibiotics resistance protein